MVLRPNVMMLLKPEKEEEKEVNTLYHPLF